MRDTRAATARGAGPTVPGTEPLTPPLRPRPAPPVSAVIKIVAEAGKANPSPPVGPALGAKGVNIMAFCKEYNAKTAAQAGEIIPAVITVFEDKSFTFILKTPPTSVLIKKAVGIAKVRARTRTRARGRRRGRGRDGE